MLLFNRWRIWELEKCFETRWKWCIYNYLKVPDATEFFIIKWLFFMWISPQCIIKNKAKTECGLMLRYVHGCYSFIAEPNTFLSLCSSENNCKPNYISFVEWLSDVLHKSRWAFFLIDRLNIRKLILLQIKLLKTNSWLDNNW